MVVVAVIWTRTGLEIRIVWVVEFVKRHMGHDDGFSFEYRGKSYDPEMLSSFILGKLKHDAELRLGHRVDQAVITVPAYFNDIQRRATLRAGARVFVLPRLTWSG